MRRLNRDDRGVTVVLVTVGMTAVLLIAALALDMGSAFRNKQRAQTSADARALAAAINCAQGKSVDTALPALKAHQAPVPSPSGLNISSCAGQTQVTATVTETQDASFMPGSLTVTHDATAKWGGTIETANVLPMAFASCEWSLALLDGTADITVYLDDPKKQSGCTSLPGGFSQLEAGDTTCSIEVDENGDVDGQPGGALQKKELCIAPLPMDVLVPIYDETALSKENHDNGSGPYHILGYAMFHITGYSFNGSANGGTLGEDCPVRPDDPTAVDDKGKPLPDPKYCIRGDFIRSVAPGDAVPGPSQDFGVTTVSLIH